MVVSACFNLFKLYTLTEPESQEAQKDPSGFGNLTGLRVAP